MKSMIRIKKRVLLTLIIVTVCCATIIPTAAWLFSKTGPLSNMFDPATVSCTVSKDGETYSVTNTGDVDAYLRVAVVVNWTSDDGHVYYNGSASFDVGSGAAWTPLLDGYYYHTEPVPAGATVVFGAVTITSDPPSASYPHANVQVLAEAIQSEPAEHLNETWGIKITDGVWSYDGICAHISRRTQDNGNGTHTEVCNTCGMSLSMPIAHNWSSAVSAGDTQHTKTCQTCSAELTEDHAFTYTGSDTSVHAVGCRDCDWTGGDVAHTPADALVSVSDTQHKTVCTLCGGQVGDLADHAWTETNTNTQHTKTCACGKSVTHSLAYDTVNSTSTQHIFACGTCSFSTAAADHTLTTTYDTTTHTTRCTATNCGYEVNEAHTLSYAYMNDTYHKVSCSDCSYSENINHYWGDDGKCTATGCTATYIKGELIQPGVAALPGTLTEGDLVSGSGTVSSGDDLIEYPDADSTVTITGSFTGNQNQTISNTGYYLDDETTEIVWSDPMNPEGNTRMARAGLARAGGNNFTISVDLVGLGLSGTHTLNFVIRLNDGTTIIARSITLIGIGMGAPTKSHTMLSEQMQPILDANSSTHTVYDEPVMFIEEQNANQHTENMTRDLLYGATGILKVTSYDGKTIYVEGWDYELVNGNIVRLPGGRIPYLDYSKWTNPSEDTRFQVPTGQYVYYSEDTEFIKYQVYVTYRTNEKWGDDFAVEAGQPDAFDYYIQNGTLGDKNFLAKMREGRDVTIFFYGDSITWGCNAGYNMGYSGKNDAQAYGSYSLQFVQALADIYGYTVKYVDTSGLPDSVVVPSSSYVGGTRGTITYINTAVGGYLSGPAQGINRDGISQYAARVKPYTDVYGCDLFVWAFGMNDPEVGIDAATTAANARTVTDAVKASNPGADIVLVSTMVPNSLFDTRENKRYAQEAYLEQLAAEKTYALVRMTLISQSMQRFKTFQECSGSNINHPNDYYCRVYAQMLLEAIVGYKNVQSEYNTYHAAASNYSGQLLNATVDSSFTGFHSGTWAACIDYVNGVACGVTHNQAEGDITIAPPMTGSTIAISGWAATSAGQNRIVFSIDRVTWYAAKTVGASPTNSDPTTTTEAARIGAAAGATDTTNARYFCSLDLHGYEGQMVTVSMALVTNSNQLVHFATATVTVPRA